MAASLSLVLVLAAAVAGAAVLLRRTPPSPDRAVAAARAHSRRGVAAAVAAGATAAVLAGVTRLGDTGGPGELGVTALLVPVAGGVGVLGTLLGTELSWPRPAGRVRRAGLVHRGLLDAAPVWLVRSGAVVLAGAVAVLAGGTLLADDSGRGITAVDGSAGVTAAASPFPGSTYALPALLGLLVLWGTALGALRVVADRAAVTLEDPDTEAALRRASVHRVLRTAVGTTAFVAGGLLAVGGNAARAVASTTGGWPVLGTTASALGLAAALAGVALLFLPAPRLPAPADPAPAGRP